MLKKNLLLFLISLSFIILNYIFYLTLIAKYPNLIDNSGNININNLHFFFGRVIENLIENNTLYFKHGYHGMEVNYYLGRLPLIPLFLTFIIEFISNSYLKVLIIKNLILFSILLCILKKISNKNYFIIFSFFIFIYNPHNISTPLSLVPEEGYTSYLILIIFLLMVNIKTVKDIFLISIMLFITFFSKASMVYLCYILSIYLIFRLKTNFKFIYSIVPIIFVFFAYLTWASYGYMQTKKFISPLSISTMSGSTLIVSSNNRFKDFYPLTTPDILESEMWLEHKENLYNNSKLKDEFEINNYFVDQSKKYILKNKFEFLKVSFKKIHVIFTNLKKDAQPELGEDFNSIRFSNIPNKFVLILCVFLILKDFYKKKFHQNNLIFFLILISFLFPYIIGWAYTRHIVPLYIISHFYLFLRYRHIVNDCFNKFINLISKI